MVVPHAARARRERVGTSHSSSAPMPPLGRDPAARGVMAQNSHRFATTMNRPISEHRAELAGLSDPDLKELPQQGEIFDGKYRIDGVLGVGGMAAVLAATHLGLDERVALKVLLPESSENPGLVQRFMGEGRASSKIRSEHVVRVMDVGIADGRPS